MNEIRDAYVIDFDSKSPEVLLYERETIIEDLEAFKLKDVQRLDSPDWKIFSHERDAIDFLKRYNETLRALDNAVICKSRSLPAMLYKRKYIVQALMRVKKHTERDYRKNWTSGQLFNFHDQTYFLTVRLKKITQLDDNGYRYDYELL